MAGKSSSTDARNRRPENTVAKESLKADRVGKIFEFDASGKGLISVASTPKDRSEFPAAVFETEDGYESTGSIPMSSLGPVPAAMDGVEASTDVVTYAHHVLHVLLSHTSPGGQVREVTEDYVHVYGNTREGPLWHLAGEHNSFWEPGIWSCIVAGGNRKVKERLLTHLPDARGSRSKGIYIGLVSVSNFPIFGLHLRAYVGLAGADTNELLDGSDIATIRRRVTNHNSIAHRQAYQNELHKMMDLKGSTTPWKTAACYPSATGPGHLLIAEGLLIASLGTFESTKLYERMNAVPSCIGGLHSPSFGLNEELTLSYQITSTSHANIMQRNHSRTLIEMITTGKVVTWGGEPILSLSKQHDIRLNSHWTKLIPELKSSNAGVLFISLSRDSIHPQPFLQWNAGKIMGDDTPLRLQHFGVWLQ